jgi:cell division protein FtsZ
MDETEEKPVFSEDNLTANAKIKVIGVGGGGSNAVNQMIQNKSDDVEYWVVNTDCQALANSPCENKYVLGKNVTRGLGAGGNPEMGKKAATDSYKDLELLVKGADLVFIAAGEGGGTGTGAAPVIAKAAKEAGCLVLAIVTRPFNFEGKGRRLNALEGINELKKYVDSLIVVSNDKLVFNNGSMSLKSAFAASDAVLAQSVKTSMVSSPRRTCPASLRRLERLWSDSRRETRSRFRAAIWMAMGSRKTWSTEPKKTEPKSSSRSITEPLPKTLSITPWQKASEHSSRITTSLRLGRCLTKQSESSTR